MKRVAIAIGLLLALYGVLAIAGFERLIVPPANSFEDY